MSNLKIFSAVLGVSLRALRLSCDLTQRALTYAEDAEKLDQLNTPFIAKFQRTFMLRYHNHSSPDQPCQKRHSLVSDLTAEVILQ